MARKRSGESGASLVEFSLVVLPLFACLFLIMDVAWIFFGWACIQEGAREGVRYAVTGSGTAEGTLDTSTKGIVQQYSFGFANNLNNIVIHYYPSTGYSSSGSPASLDGQPGATAVGNVVTVTVSASMGTFGPIFRTWTPVNLSATASDLLQ